MDIEYIVIDDLIRDYIGDDNTLSLFKKYFPKGGYAIDVLKKFAELKYYSFTEDILWRLPYNEIPLHINNVNDSIFYLGNVIINGDVCISKPSFIKGDLIIKGSLTVRGTGHIATERVKANSISIYNSASIYGEIKANTITICLDEPDNFKLSIPEKTESLEDNYTLYGKVNANIINNNGGLLGGTYYVNEITNYGKIDGRLIFKEPKAFNKYI